MLDTSHDFSVCSEELGLPVEQLLTPLTRYARREPDKHFAIDNGAYSGFECESFKSLLKREINRNELCRFVAVPDVVGSARRTLEVFDYWRQVPDLRGWPLALVAQDGQEDLPIEWYRLSAIFIGGTDSWKTTRHAEAIVRAAKARGLWVHVGRINTWDRFDLFKEWGADSFDGTGISRYSHMRTSLRDGNPLPQLQLDGAA